MTAYEWDILSLSLKVALVATAAALPVATALAYLMARRNFPFKNIIETLLNLPLVMPPVVTGYILLLIFSPSRPFGSFLEKIGISFAFSWTGAALASFIMALPLMVRTIRQSFELEDPIYRQVATTLGLHPWLRIMRISLPLAVPGLISGVALGFARAIGEFGATITFVSNIPGLTQTLPLGIYSASQSPDGEAAALRLVLIALIPAIGSLLISQWLSRRTLARRGL